MRAILIDPDTRTVTEIETKGDLHAMYEALTRPGCPAVDDINAVRIGLHHVLWVDGEGLLKPDVPIFRFGVMSPSMPKAGLVLAGRGLVLGDDGKGDTIGARAGIIGTVRSLILWTDEFSTGELGPSIEEPGKITLGAGILKTITTPGSDTPS